MSFGAALVFRHSTPGADKYAICSAIGADSRVGTKYIRPGYGFGGPCFPRDNRALGGYGEMVGIDALLFKATDAYNKYHTEVQLKNMLAEGKDDYVFTGVAYKPSTKVRTAIAVSFSLLLLLTLTSLPSLCC